MTRDTQNSTSNNDFYFFYSYIKQLHLYKYYNNRIIFKYIFCLLAMKF